jgi:uncharacterized YigZ family protein
MPKDTYYTIGKPAEGMYREKGSKFLAFAYPVYNSDEIKKHIDSLKKKYHDARHHCWAYALGAGREEFRVNDDGEPHNSAGKPIFGQIQSFNVTNILLVVVRYFGGTLLGVGGLTNAYKTAAADCLKNAGIIEKKITRTIRIECGYENVDEVMRVAREEKLEIVRQQFEEICRIDVAVKLSDYQRIYDRYSQLNLLHISS